MAPAFRRRNSSDSPWKKSDEKERDRIVANLRTNGIGASIYYVKPIHMMPYYQKKFGKYHLPKTEKIAKKVFSLPVHPGLDDSKIEFIADTLLKIL